MSNSTVRIVYDALVGGERTQFMDNQAVLAQARTVVEALEKAGILDRGYSTKEPPNQITS